MRRRAYVGRALPSVLPLSLVGGVAAGGTLSLVWLALKVGALSFGGGFVIVPLMQADAVNHYHWLTQSGFLDAVALGQITPGPVVQTVAVIGYAAAGIGGGLLAALVAFSPSLAFVLLGGSHFGRLRTTWMPRRSSTAPGPQRSARSWARRSPSHARSLSRGNTRSQPGPYSRCSCCGAAS